jgi:hypothetical protein
LCAEKVRAIARDIDVYEFRVLIAPAMVVILRNWSLDFVGQGDFFPFYGWSILILALLIPAIVGLSAVYNWYRKQKTMKRLARERYMREGTMIVCANCGLELMKTCPDCGKQLFETILHCPLCGKPLET